MNRMKVKSGMAAPLVLAVTVLGASSAASAETPCWAVREWKGAPALFRDGKPTRHRLLPLQPPADCRQPRPLRADRQGGVGRAPADAGVLRLHARLELDGRVRPPRHLPRALPQGPRHALRAPFLLPAKARRGRAFQVLRRLLGLQTDGGKWENKNKMSINTVFLTVLIYCVLKIIN